MDELDEVVITARRPRQLSPDTVVMLAWVALGLVLVLGLRR